MGIHPLLLIWILFTDFNQPSSALGSFKDKKGEKPVIHSSLPEYLYHEVIVPKIYVNQKQRDTTLHQQGHHSEDVTLKFQAFNRSFILELKRNRKLFSTYYIEKRVHDGGSSIERPPKSKEQHCYYHGSISGSLHSMVALSTCRGITGLISDDRESYHIEPALDVDLRHHRIYRESDKKSAVAKCGRDHSHSHPSNSRATEDVLKTHHVLKRMKRNVKGPYDSNINSRYVELYLVLDHTIYINYGRNTARVIERSHNIANIVSKFYQPLNIYIALVGVETWETVDGIDISILANDTLDHFLHYRKERINPYHPNDNSQLITGKTFQDGVVGKAIKGAVCTYQYSGGVNSDLQNSLTQISTTVAHELGHNFGMEHDNYSICQCPDSNCIMAPTSGGYFSPDKWSSCSRRALEEAYELGMDYCLVNKPKQIADGPMCGNGFVEKGEECDCGLKEDCNTKCCNATTCKLTAQSSCATGACCELSKCQPKSAATLCRPSRGECDLPEFCLGDSEYCPADVYGVYGVPCNGGQSYCYMGDCRTHTDQCKLLWGSTGRVSDPVCFRHLNINGSKHGNCGYNWTSNIYYPCNRDDTLCGLLHCVHLNEKLMFWKESLAHDTPATFLTLGSNRYVCRSAMLDVGLDMPDPGMVPDGAKCGSKKICVKHKCTSLSQLPIHTCESDCDHGVCNNKGHCHCEEGYAPPYCTKPGNGGSVDSGPIKILENNSLLVGMLVFFLVVLPMVGILAFLAYYHRQRLKKWWTTSANDLKHRVPSRTKKPPPRNASNSSAADVHKSRPIVLTVQTGNTLEISTPILTGSTNRDSHIHIQENPFVFAPPIVKKTSAMKQPNSVRSVNEFTPHLGSFKKPSSSSVLKDQSFKKPKQIEFELPKEDLVRKPMGSPILSIPSQIDSIKKRESFKETISNPVLISTTDRRSKAFVKEPSCLEDSGFKPLGEPPPIPPHSSTLRHTKSKNVPPPRPTSFPPRPHIDESCKKPVTSSSLRMPERPPPPPGRSIQAPKPDATKNIKSEKNDKQIAMSVMKKNPSDKDLKPPISCRPQFDNSNVHNTSNSDVSSVKSSDSKYSKSSPDSESMSLADLITKIKSPNLFNCDSLESNVSSRNEKQSENKQNVGTSNNKPVSGQSVSKINSSSQSLSVPNKNNNKGSSQSSRSSSLQNTNQVNLKSSPLVNNNKGNKKTSPASSLEGTSNGNLKTIKDSSFKSTKKGNLNNNPASSTEQKISGNSKPPTVVSKPSLGVKPDKKNDLDPSAPAIKASDVGRKLIQPPLSRLGNDPLPVKPNGLTNQVLPTKVATTAGTGKPNNTVDTKRGENISLAERNLLPLRGSDVSGEATQPKPDNSVFQQKGKSCQTKPAVEQRGQQLSISSSFNKLKSVSDSQKSPTSSELKSGLKTKIKSGVEIKEAENSSETDVESNPSGPDLSGSNSGVKALLAKFDSPQGNPQLGTAVARNDSRIAEKPSLGLKPRTRRKEVKSVNV